MKEASEESIVRIKEFTQWDIDVAILIKIGKKRFPFTIDGARGLYRQIGKALEIK